MAEEAPDTLIQIPTEHYSLEGILQIPAQANRIVLFAHGTGSSRHSPRNQYVAQVLREAQIGTLLFDLLTNYEEEVYSTRFDIHLLTNRLLTATQWVREREDMKDFHIGYFGASTGAAAALCAAAELRTDIQAVVSRGGRPDLAGEALESVEAPTLLIVGGLDDVVIDLNKESLARLRCKKELSIVPNATHLFEEPGTLEQAAHLAAEWFQKHL